MREVVVALNLVPFQEIVSSFNPRAAEEARVYGANHMPTSLDEEEKASLIEWLQLLQNVYADAAVKGNGVILWVT